ncbi:MAG: hypothetical protein JWM89_1307 [Acidimicrobiales bacterium]|nr:hypothetical protein [Acidimicrobiales bacterium]
MSAVRTMWRSAGLRWAMLAIIALLVAMDLYQVSFVPGHIDTARVGTLGEWFAALATVGTIAIAALTLRGDRIKQSEAEHQQRLESAGAIYCWLERRLIRPGLADMVLVTENKTDVPAYTWRMTMEGHSAQAMSDQYGPLLPGQQAIVLKGFSESAGPGDGGPLPRVDLYFQSWLGSELHRRFDGSLEEVPADE